MKIAMITAVFPPYAGGMGNVAFEYAEFAGKAGHTLTVFAPKYGNVEPARSPHFASVPLQPLFTFGNAALIRSFEGLIPSDTDLVHIHYPCIGFVWALWRWHRNHPKIPVLITYHMDLVASGWKGIFFKWYTKCALPMIFSCAKIVHITSLDYFQHSIAKKYLKNQEVKEIPLGVDTSFFYPTNPPATLFLSFGILPHEKILLFVGALDSAHTFKGVDVLLRSFAQCAETAKLVIIGTGNMKIKYERMAQEMGISSRVIFTGFIDRKDLSYWYGRAHVLILPSISSSEAFGKVLLEAQSCGTPVIASDLYGVREVVDEYSGMRVVPEDNDSLNAALSKLLSLSDEEYALARTKCRVFILQNFDQKDILNALLEQYRDVVQKVARIHSGNV